MPKLTIDQREVEVPQGATLLDAARKLNVDVPTLCYLKGYDPSTSCLVCMVKVTATGRFVPSCATKAVDGIEIESETSEVHQVRRTALELLLSDHVGDCYAPCYFACPAHMDIPGMLRDISREDVGSAIAIVKHDIALPAVLGRVCTKPCEKGCRRNSTDQPVEVCELKRFVADEDLATGNPYRPECKPDTGKRVAVVGSGPTGLAAAYHLRRDGHAVTIIEASSQLGGRLRREFDADLLPPDTLDAEIATITMLGMDVRLNTRLGDDVALQQLLDDFHAVLVATGKNEASVAEGWGVAAGKRGIEINNKTFETKTSGVFAAGNAIRGKGLVVRSVADGKEAAGTIGEFVLGKPITPVSREFSSRIGKPREEEMPEFLAAGSDGPAWGDKLPDPQAVKLPEASGQADRCLACGCAAQGNCKLEHYAAQYGADTGKYAGFRRAFVQVNRGGSVIYEPGKCINCELCVQVVARSETALGLSFVGRGFDVRIGIPFQGTMEEALGDLAAECIAVCPTGALYYSPMHEGAGTGGCCGGQGSCHSNAAEATA